MTQLMTSLALFLSVAASGCGGSNPPQEVYDFSGLVPFDLSRSAFDAATTPPDFSGYDLTCDPAMPLSGGNPSGHWKYYGACASADALYQITATCMGITFDSVVLQDPDGTGRAYGTLDLDGGGTFSRDSHAMVNAHANVPSACTQPFGSCANFGTGESSEFNWLTMTCASSASGCSCAISADLSKSETGTWSATQTGFTTTSSLGGAQPFAASASTNELRHRGDDTTLRGNRGITYVLIR